MGSGVGVGGGGRQAEKKKLLSHIHLALCTYFSISNQLLQIAERAKLGARDIHKFQYSVIHTELEEAY